MEIDRAVRTDRTFINAEGEVIETCLECGSQFVRYHGKRVFCSEKCSNRNRQRKYRNRHKEKNIDTLQN